MKDILSTSYKCALSAITQIPYFWTHVDMSFFFFFTLVHGTHTQNLSIFMHTLHSLRLDKTAQHVHHCTLDVVFMT
jgi:hypothetical protein